MHISQLNMKRSSFVVISLLVATSFMASCVSASVVQSVTLSEAAQKSQLIIEGQVVSKQVRYGPNAEPFTYFTIQILDVIKGTYAAPTIEIGYMGGTTADGLTMQVSDMRMPEVGEHGIYFVESLTRQQVHPLYGWQQGHYLVTPPQVNTPARVMPVNTPPGAMVAAPSLSQFKLQVRALSGTGQ